MISIASVDALGTAHEIEGPVSDDDQSDPAPPAETEKNILNFELEKAKPSETVEDEIVRLYKANCDTVQEVIRQTQEVILRTIRMGELLEKKNVELDHGEWLPWLKNMPFSRQTADNYRMLYLRRNELNCQRISNLTQAYKLLRNAKKEAKRPRKPPKVNPADFVDQTGVEPAGNPESTLGDLPTEPPKPVADDSTQPEVTPEPASTIQLTPLEPDPGTMDNRCIIVQAGEGQWQIARYLDGTYFNEEEALSAVRALLKTKNWNLTLRTPKTLWTINWDQEP